MNEQLQLQNQVDKARLEAQELHTRIMANGMVVASAMVEFSRELKEMRDKKLYQALGYAEFGEYVEQAVGLKQRQAYTYISNYERLGPKLLEEQAHLGVTKLGLLGEISAPERAEFAQEHDLAGMTVNEVKALVQKATDQGKQLSMLEIELADAASGEKTYKAEAERLAAELEQARGQTADLRLRAEGPEAAQSADLGASNGAAQGWGSGKQAGRFAEQMPGMEPGKDPAEWEKKLEEARRAAAEDAQREAQAQAARTLKEERARLRRELEAKQEKEAAEKLAAARGEGEKKAREELEAAAAREKARLEAEKKDAEQRALELAKKLELAASRESTAFAVWFDQLQAAFNKMLEQAAALEGQSKAEEAGKLRAALKKALAVMAERV